MHITLAFLTDKTQYGCINNKCVLQMYQLRLRLYNEMYWSAAVCMSINDLPTAYNDCKVKLYADHVKLYTRINGAMDCVTLQLALNAFCS